MRKTVTIIVLLCFILPFAGSYTFLHLKKRELRKEVKRKMIAGLSETELVLLKFSSSSEASELRWEHSREFEYRGEMYDVVSTAVRGDSIFYHCWKDHAETQLNLRLQKLVLTALGNNPQSNQQQKSFSRFYFSLYRSQVLVWKIILPVADKVLIHHKNFCYKNPFSVPVSPPPEVI